VLLIGFTLIGRKGKDIFLLATCKGAWGFRFRKSGILECVRPLESGLDDCTQIAIRATVLGCLPYSLDL
jgi:hypothetical protein